MGSTAKFRALVQGGTQHIRTALGKAKAATRRRPRLIIGVGAGVVLAAAAGVAFSAGWHEDALELVEDAVATQPTLAELKARAKREPLNAGLQAELGHAYFAEGARLTALKAYGRALSLSAKTADATMTKNLLACFGRREQAKAANLLGKYRMTGAADRLQALVRDKRASVRGDALRALAEMGKATRADYVVFYMYDLDSSRCETRKRAVDKLAAYADKGDKRVVAAIRTAAKKDADETPWYRRSCLADSAEQAEKRILARR